MRLSQRIRNLAIAALIIIASILMMSMPSDGILITAIIFVIALFVTGARFLLFYLTMARHMVGGKTYLIFGIIALDMGLFMLSVVFQDLRIILLFLQIFYGFSGGVDILRARQSRKAGAPIWKINMMTGLINITFMALALICGYVWKSQAILVYIFCAGLIYSAIMRIIAAFRKTAVVYIA